MAKKAKPLIRQKANGQTIRLDMDPAGVKKFLQSEDVGDMVEEAAVSYVLPIVKGLSSRRAEWSVERFVGRDRQRVSVGTANVEAMLAEAQNRVLTRAIGMVTSGKKPR